MGHNKQFPLGCTCKDCTKRICEILEENQERFNIPLWADDRFIRACENFTRRTGMNPLRLLEPDEVLSDCSCGGAGTCARCKRAIWLASEEYAGVKAAVDKAIQEADQGFTVREASAAQMEVQRLAEQLNVHEDFRCSCSQKGSECWRCRIKYRRATKEDLLILVQLRVLVQEALRLISS
ncbi:hypothetical protein [Thermosporothrix hazakensis]|jgi:hypothetical protein|nr:hypothetical protein [Thermosporothrix hazakensis]